MKQEITAKELLAQIERRYFKGAGLAKASTLEGDERRAYVLAQVERLLTIEHGFSLLAMYLSEISFGCRTSSWWSGSLRRSMNR